MVTSAAVEIQKSRLVVSMYALYREVMQNAIKQHHKYCKELIKTHEYMRYLLLAFIPRKHQAAVGAFYALRIELMNVRNVVTEEMLGHIRYAWWQESIEGLDSEQRRDHPVINALAATDMDREKMLALVTAYREAYPEFPENIEIMLDEAVPLTKRQEKRFYKAKSTIEKHQGSRAKLLWKLMFV